MKKLSRHIIDAWVPLAVNGSFEGDVTLVTDDSRKVIPGALFVAVKGFSADGHRYIDKALEKGAAVIVSERAVENLPGGKLNVVVKDTRRILPALAQWFYGNPSEDLHLIGVTGTNGKTSVATLAYRLFQKAGFKAGLISTVEIKIDDKTLPSVNTTPGLIDLYALLKNMKDEGVEYVFMEVSSHGIDQGRIAGLRFAGGIFTNLTRDHLDYHGSFIRYRDTKKRFFDMLPSTAFALTNIDDKNGLFMLQNTRAAKYTYGLRNPADFKTEIVEMDFEGMLLRINRKEVWTPLTGTFNAYNLTAVYAAAVLSGMPEDEALLLLSTLEGVKGRLEKIISADGKIGIVDYAHTPDALEKILKSVAEIRPEGRKIITVFGAGGDRDKGKRPLMGKTAALWSDLIVVTDDNPRTEDSRQIIDDILQGIPADKSADTLVIPDRRQAIKTAVKLARPGDIIVVAGKGHENYQIIGTKKLPFDDAEELRKNFKSF